MAKRAVPLTIRLSAKNHEWLAAESERREVSMAALINEYIASRRERRPIVESAPVVAQAKGDDDFSWE